jgi:hypothetical protein
MSRTNFPEWLEAQLAKRGMLPFHLAKKAGVGASTIQNLLSGERHLGPDVACAIAKSLELPQVTVFLAASLMTEAPLFDGRALDAQITEGLEVLIAMAPKHRDIAIKMLKIIAA